ncbi:solute carrier organic anion transporter family member 4A1-like isoform X1 [Daphnia pulex]|uniref:solute carrier organic anion transporter family member 4A1-like isoform X1 n=1 Tax=Daphnia pulex TaxID=6669 RepID=UPI001EDDBA4C|nr:solute carrier organic anion transporter family member 4A1-like isoform X1 [Daphnia pulex]
MEMANTVTNAKSSDPASTADFDDGGGQCGWYCWKPKFLQRLSTSKSFLFWICWAGGFQSFLINGLLNVCVSTIERRYDLTSTDSGMIIGCYDIASFLTVLPVSYLGGRKGACKPHWVGYGVLLLGIGSFVFATPHLTSGLYQASVKEQVINTCSLSVPSMNASCSTSDQLTAGLTGGWALQKFKYVFLVAQLIMGAGGAPLYTLGTAFIDENVSHKMQPIYSGIFYGSTMLGPALGYIAGGQLLRLYVDFDTISANEVGMAPGSSGWIGAWWLGFVIAGTLLCIAAIPLLAFPGELLGAKALAAAKEAEHSKTEDPEDDDDYDSKNDSKSTTPDGAISVGQSLRELPLAIKELATRWTFLFICLEQSCEAMLLAGFGAFLPKIIESQFSLSPAMAAIIVGGLVIPCGCGASYSGGYLIKHYRMRPRTILKMSCFLVSLSFIFSLAFMVYCPNQDFAGVTIPYSGKHELKIVSDCNAKCSCSLDTYDPICGIDNILYYSPCHAGCTSSHETLVNGSKSFAVYSNCSCITSPEYKRMKVMGGAEIDVMAARQTCTSAKCNHQLYLFTILLFLFLALVFMNSMPILSATLRSVPYNRRAFALGTQMIIWRLLGAIPGPMIFGLFIDSSCVLWSHTNNECGDNSDNSGSCLIYNNYSFSRAMVGLALVVKGFTFLFATLSWWFYTPSTVTKASNGVQEVAATSANPEAKTKEIYAYDNTAVDRNE